MVVMTLLLLVGCILLAGFILICLTAPVLYQISHQHQQSTIKLTILGCGLLYDLGRNRAAVTIGKWHWSIGKRKQKRSALEKSTRRSKLKKKAGEKEARKMSWNTRLKIIKAMMISGARLLSRIKYEDARLQVRPVMADPALAGMAYGWGAAIYGIFPGLRETIDICPDFGAEKTHWNGHLILSIRIRQVVYVGYGLLLDLPIRELIAYWMKRGK